MAGAEVQRLVVQLDLEGNAQGGIAKLNRQVGLLGRGTARMGKGVAQVGAGFARAGLLVGGAALAGITAAAKAGIDFEDAFAGVRKTVNETDLRKAGLSFDILSKQFREMATTMPLSAVEFARVGEIAGALGVKAQDITEFTRVTAQLGVTTNLTSDAAADAFGRIGTILGLTGKEYTQLADSVVALGNAGASTESEIVEITKRFAATAKQAGLTKEQMVGLASATASLGFEPERGGSALARVFANMATNISTANAKGKALGKGLGRSIKDMQRDINRGKGLTIFQDILETVRDMKPTEAARFLKNIGVTNVSDRTIFLAMSQQLPFVNEQLEIARKSQGALLAEAEKKFATTASKIQVFKNNLIEAGISLSEGFLPAVGRALDKLITAFKDPATQGDIVQLGKDIGAAIDDVDWGDVLSNARSFVGVLKSALDVTLAILNAVNQLPTEIKAAGAAFLALEKLSGGLIGRGIGNIAGGAVTAAASRLPGVGKLFAQPVFVTNWPIGGVGGGVAGAAGKGGIGALGKMFLVGEAIGLVAAVEGVRQDLSGQATRQAQEVGSTLNQMLANNPTQAQIRTALDGVNSGISQLQSNPLHVLVQGNALAELQQMKAKLTAALQPSTQSPDRKDDKTTHQKLDSAKQAIEAAKVQNSERIAQVKSATDKVRAAALETKRETSRGVTATQAQGGMTRTTVRSSALTGAAITAGATRSTGAAIISAIYAARPIVNVTNVTRQTTIQQRFGPSSGSAGTDTGHAPGTGPLP